MAEDATLLSFVIEVDPATGKAKLKEFENQVERTRKNTENDVLGMGEAFNTLKNQIVGALTVMGAVAGAVALARWMGENATMAAEAESAQIKLGASLKATGQWSAKLFDSIVANNDALQQSTNIDGDAATAAQAMALRMGVAADQLNELTRVAADFAAFSGREIDESMKAIARTITTKTGRALKELGFDLDEATLSAMSANEILKLIGGKTAGAAEASMNTFAGAVTRVTRAWGEIRETIGKFIAQSPTVQIMVKMVSDWLYKLNSNLDAGIDIFKPFGLAMLQTGIIMASWGETLARLVTGPGTKFLIWLLYVGSGAEEFMNELAAVDLVMQRMGLTSSESGDAAAGAFGDLRKTLTEAYTALKSTDGKLTDVKDNIGRLKDGSPITPADIIDPKAAEEIAKAEAAVQQLISSIKKLKFTGMSKTVPESRDSQAARGQMINIPEAQRAEEMSLGSKMGPPTESEVARLEQLKQWNNSYKELIPTISEVGATIDNFFANRPVMYGISPDEVVMPSFAETIKDRCLQATTAMTLLRDEWMITTMSIATNSENFASAWEGVYQALGATAGVLQQVLGEHNKFSKGMQKVQAAMLYVTGIISIYEGAVTMAEGFATIMTGGGFLIAAGAAQIASGTKAVAQARAMGGSGAGSPGGAGRGGKGGGGKKNQPEATGTTNPTEAPQRETKVTLYIAGQGFVQDYDAFSRELAVNLQRELDKVGR